MQLSKYINELLYRYECVIVPNFGGFVSNVVSSKIDKTTQTFTPPSKLISFNIHLTQNDGLLANHVAKNEKISYEEALEKIQRQVAAWNVTLLKGVLDFPKIGTLSYQDTKLIFEPYNTTNFLTASFGLDKVKSSIVLRKNKVTITKTHKRVASIAAVIALAWVGNSTIGYQNVYEQLTQQSETQELIQQATFNILKPLPEITVEIENNTISTKEINYSIVAGAFKNVENAEKLLSELKEKGYKASIIGKNSWGLTQVSYGDFSNKDKAQSALVDIKAEENPNAWLFVHNK